MRRQDREILRLALPALGTLAVEPLYVLVDTAIVGRMGTDQLAGLAIAAIVLTAVFGLCNFLAYGTTAIVARFVGADEPGHAARHGIDALWLGAAIGTALCVVGLAAADPIVTAMGASDSVAPYALTYLRISLLGAPAVLVGLAGMGYLRGCQDTVTPLVIVLSANLANLAIELVAVYGLDSGIAGSAWSTVIAQYGAVTAFVVITVGAAARAGVGVRPDARGIRQATRIGMHLVIRTAALLAAFLVATAIASRIDDEALAAHQVAFQVWLFLALALDAIAIAAQALLGRYLGQGDRAGSRATARRMLQWGVLMGCGLALAVLALRPLLGAAFTEDPAVRSLLDQLLLVVALTQPLNAVVFVLDGILIGAGETRYLAAAMAVALGVYLPVALLVLAAGLGLIALWFALTWFMVARTLGMWLRYRGDAWIVTGATRAA